MFSDMVGRLITVGFVDSKKSNIVDGKTSLVGSVIYMTGELLEVSDSHIRIKTLTNEQVISVDSIKRMRYAKIEND